MSEPFDFASVDDYLQLQEEGTPVEIVLPNGKATGLTVTMAGLNSERAKMAFRWGATQRSKPNISDEKHGDINREEVARCALGWSGARRNGEDVPFSQATLMEWMERLPFIYAQLVEASGDLKRFIKA